MRLCPGLLKLIVLMTRSTRNFGDYHLIIKIYHSCWPIWLTSGFKFKLITQNISRISLSLNPQTGAARTPYAHTYHKTCKLYFVIYLLLHEFEGLIRNDKGREFNWTIFRPFPQTGRFNFAPILTDQTKSTRQTDQLPNSDWPNAPNSVALPTTARRALTV